MEEHVAPGAGHRQIERRESARYDFSGDIEIEWNSKKIRGCTKNISRSGMFVELPDGPELGSVFSAKLALQTPLQIECRVRRVVPGRGVGVSIVVVGKEEQARYEALLGALSLGSNSVEAAGAQPSEGRAEEPFGRFRWVSPEAASGMRF